jgi:hypothetical protein
MEARPRRLAFAFGGREKPADARNRRARKGETDRVVTKVSARLQCAAIGIHPFTPCSDASRERVDFVQFQAESTLACELPQERQAS